MQIVSQVTRKAFSRMSLIPFFAPTDKIIHALAGSSCGRICALAPVLLNIMQRSNAPGGTRLPPVERLKTGRFPVSLVSTRDIVTGHWLVSGKTFRAQLD
jgi:hypothetical protein